MRYYNLSSVAYVRCIGNVFVGVWYINRTRMNGISSIISSIFQSDIILSI